MSTEVITIAVGSVLGGGLITAGTTAWVARKKTPAEVRDVIVSGAETAVLAQSATIKDLRSENERLGAENAELRRQLAAAQQQLMAAQQQLAAAMQATAAVQEQLDTLSRQIDHNQH